ncbi:MAG: hypothetical protein EZS28_009163 [Streblomastix strix]|uniref:Uncharacterized protein n=1 Tax=Streblomastix strix TaxID=222440 RepID=A0A5J4WKG9_9EUKA|nr:MAG: hypothetical protein EZS28_009163 [Streblomastix strix]
MYRKLFSTNNTQTNGLSKPSAVLLICEQKLMDHHPYDMTLTTIRSTKKPADEDEKQMQRQYAISHHLWGSINPAHHVVPDRWTTSTGDAHGIEQFNEFCDFDTQDLRFHIVRDDFSNYTEAKVKFANMDKLKPTGNNT